MLRGAEEGHPAARGYGNCGDDESRWSGSWGFRGRRISPARAPGHEDLLAALFGSLQNSYLEGDAQQQCRRNQHMETKGGEGKTFAPFCAAKSADVRPLAPPPTTTTSSGYSPPDLPSAVAAAICLILPGQRGGRCAATTERSLRDVDGAPIPIAALAPSSERSSWPLQSIRPLGFSRSRALARALVGREGQCFGSAALAFPFQPKNNITN